MPRRPETPRWKGPPNAECATCGTGFYKGGPSAAATRLFCSRKCRWIAQRRQDFRPCFVCGKKFLPTDIEGRPPQSCCSRECSREKARIKRSNAGPAFNCEQCGKHVEFNPKNHNRFCSRECSQAHWTLRPTEIACEFCEQPFITTDASRRFCSNRCIGRAKNAKATISVQCHWCKKDFAMLRCQRRQAGQVRWGEPRLFCCAAHRTAWREQKFPKTCPHCKTDFVVGRLASRQIFCGNPCRMAVLLGNNSPSKIERRVGDSLIAAGLDVVPQFAINNRYFADFALPQLRIIVEVDGDYWHSLPKTQRNDKIKTELLQEQGWDVHRLKECDLRSDWDGTLRPILGLADSLK